jgi:NTP pyrophosphatase (non-canonical NTP hydrolase)
MRPDLLPRTWDTRLARVEEECGEVIKAIGKLHRFGRLATDPKTKLKYDNVADIMAEMYDLKDAIDRFLGNR